MDEAIARDQAAETLRTVEGMRRRSIAEGSRASSFPLLIFGLAALFAAPFGELGWDGSLILAMGVGLLVAVVTTDIYYRKLLVHPAPGQKMGMWQAIVLTAVIILFGPMAIGLVLEGFAFSGASVPIFLVYTTAAVVLGKRMRNRPLAVAGVFALLATAAAPFANADHWQTIAAGLYGTVFLIGAAVVGRQRRAP